MRTAQEQINLGTAMVDGWLGQEGTAEQQQDTRNMGARILAEAEAEQRSAQQERERLGTDNELIATHLLGERSAQYRAAKKWTAIAAQVLGGHPAHKATQHLKDNLRRVQARMEWAAVAHAAREWLKSSRDLYREKQQQAELGSDKDYAPVGPSERVVLQEWRNERLLTQASNRYQQALEHIPSGEWIIWPTASQIIELTSSRYRMAPR
jgi:hypothetical protein